jgi:hypothetical protein
MGLMTACLVLSFAQAPEPQTDPRFVWPPVRGEVQRYQARLQKTRALPDELAAAERQARKAAGLQVPSRPVQQSVALAMDIELQPGDEVTVRYTIRLGATAGLRLELQPDARREGEEPPPPLGNGFVDAVWGLAEDRKEVRLEVSRAAVERTLEQRFRRERDGLAQRSDFGPLYGDHLLPVLWDHPLPAWIGHMAAALELGGEPAVEGKSLIRDATGSFPLGHRETRVELAFTKVSGDACTIRYRMRVRQVVGKTRDLKRNAAPFDWIFEIRGEADYSAGAQAFERVRETVTARPEKLGEERLARLRDEGFEGSIEIDRVREPKGRGRR